MLYSGVLPRRASNTKEKEMISNILSLIPGPIARFMLKILIRSFPKYEQRLLYIGRRFAEVEPIETEMLLGFKMALDVQDKEQRRMYYTGRYEHLVESILFKALKPSALFVDVGANVGIFTFYAATLVGEKGKVVSFEPFPATFRKLSENLVLNTKLDNIELHNSAVGRNADDVELFSVKNHSGITSVVPNKEIETESITVKCASLDSVVGGINEKFAKTVIKIDVEGAEVFVFEGMKNLLEGKYFDLLIIEIHPVQIRDLGYDPRDIPEQLHSLGYLLFTENQNKLVVFDADEFFASDEGHRFILASKDEAWEGFQIPKGF